MIENLFYLVMFVGVFLMVGRAIDDYNYGNRPPLFPKAKKPKPSTATDKFSRWEEAGENY